MENMQAAVETFLFVSIVAMVIMGAVTKSVGGAFLGLAVVCFATGLLLIQAGGPNILLGVGMMLCGFVCAVLSFGLGVNFSHSELTRYDPSTGERWTASQTLWGEGAKNSSSHWAAPASRIGDGNRPLLGSGEDRQ